jgi:hypothetical protein
MTDRRDDQKKGKAVLDSAGVHRPDGSDISISAIQVISTTQSGDKVSRRLRISIDCRRTGSDWNKLAATAETA